MKKIITIMLACAMALSLVGCQGTPAIESDSVPPGVAVQPEVNPNDNVAVEVEPEVESQPEADADVQPETEPEVEAVVLKDSDTSALADLNTLSSIENGTVIIKLLSNVELDEDGIPMLDDSNDFAVVATVGEKDYVLLEKQMIQLGVPSVSLYEDVDGKTVITVSDIRTAQYNIFEYTYDETLGGFEVVCLTQNEGINYIGDM